MSGRTDGRAGGGGSGTWERPQSIRTFGLHQDLRKIVSNRNGRRILEVIFDIMRAGA